MNKSLPIYLRPFNYYGFKYLYRIEELSQSDFYFKVDVATELTCDLNDELSRIVSHIIRGSVNADPVVFGIYNGLAKENNRGLPHATNYSDGINATHMYNTLVGANAKVINSRNIRENGRIQYIIPNANALGNNEEKMSLNEPGITGNNPEKMSLNEAGINGNNNKNPRKGVITKRRTENRRRATRGRESRRKTVSFKPNEGSRI